MQSLTILSLADALGWTLVHFLWQGAALASLYALLCRMAPERAAGWRYAVGLGTYLAMVLASLATFSHHLPAAGGPSLQAATDGVAPVLAASDLAAAYPVSWGQMLRHGLAPAMPAIVFLWTLGMCVMSTRVVAGWIGARRLRSEGVGMVSASLQDLAESLRRRLGLRRSVRIVVSCHVEVPTVIGWLKPMVLLPLGVMTGLPREQLTLVLAHELVHVRRNDYLVNLLQLALETVFFYHPAVAWLGRRVRADRELCCDDAVVAHFGQRVCYARALTRLEHLRTPGAPALAATGGDLYQRVDRIVHGASPRRSAGYAQLTLVVVLAGAAAFGLAQDLQLSSISSPALLTAPTPHSRAAMPASAMGDGWRNHRRAERARLAADREIEASDRGELARISAAGRAHARVESAADDARTRAAPVRAWPDSEPTPISPVSLPGTFDSADGFEAYGSAALSRVPKFQPVVLAPKLASPTSSQVAYRSGPPAILRQVRPDYPFRAERAGVEGRVRVTFTVDERGRPRNVSVVEATPSGVFERAAQQAIAEWRFETGTMHPAGQVYEQVFRFATRTGHHRARRCHHRGSVLCGQIYNVTGVRRGDGPSERS